MLIFMCAIALILLILLSAFFSGSETGVYRVSRLRIRLGIEENKSSFNHLQSLLEDSQGLIFSILIGNNIATALATSIATILAIKFSATAANPEFFATIVMTPTLLIFGEVLPKSIFYHHSNRYMPALSATLWFFHKLFTLTGMVAMLRFLSRGFEMVWATAKPETATMNSVAKKHIEGILQDTKNEGYLSYIQNDLANRVVNIFHVRITSVMVKMDQAAMLDINATNSEFMKLFKRYPFTRFVAYENNRSNIIGYVNVYEVLSDEQNFDLRSKLKPIHRFTPNTPVIDALNKMHDEQLRIAIIAKPRKNRPYQPLGIVTIKDLAEEITGELAVC